jgi:RNA polymerase sigma factor (TIGR02999 family)
MTHGSPGELTQLLRAWRGGEVGGRDAVFELVYEELKSIAGRRLSVSGRRIDTTELVHEAAFRLLGVGSEAQDREHFFRLAAQAIRYTLIDLSRRDHADKRGQGDAPVTLSQAQDLVAPATDWMEIEDALTRLEVLDARKCRIVELAYLVGLSQHEIAGALDLSLSTVERDLLCARVAAGGAGQ